MFVIHADAQTKGRGQRGNSFFSGEGGLYATIVCPLSDIELHFVLNRAVSLAIIDAMDARAPRAPVSIKWPNDILWADRKICGILLESLTRSGRHLAVGFGININTPADAFPPGIRNSATSLSIETGAQFGAGELLADICMRFQSNCAAPSGQAHGHYRERLYKIGAPIRINDQSGIFETVLEDGRLCMKRACINEYFSSGPMYFID